MGDKKDLDSIAQYVFYNRAWMLPTNKLVWVTDTFRMWSDEVNEDGRPIGWLSFQYNRKNGWFTQYKDEVYSIKRLSKIYNLPLLTLKKHPDQIKKHRFKKKKGRKKKEESPKRTDTVEIRDQLTAVLNSYENPIQDTEEIVENLENISDYLKANKAFRLDAFKNCFVTSDQRIWCNYIRDDGSQVGWLKPYLKDNQWYMELVSSEGEIKELAMKTLCNSASIEFSIKQMIEHPERKDTL